MKEYGFSIIMLIFILFNVVYIMAYPDTIFEFTYEKIIGFIASIIVVGALTGITIFGSGLQETSIKIIFVVVAIVNMLFQVDIAGFPIGLGLATTMFNVFSESDLMLVSGLGLGTIITTTMTGLAILWGMMMAGE